MLDLTKLREDIETEASRLGFDHIGIAPALPVPHYKEYLEWINTGFNANMTYLARQDNLEKRGDPRVILEGCQSIICLTVSYFRPKMGLGEIQPGNGRISCYAQTKDYHTQINEMLYQLENFIRSKAEHEVQVKSYVDTGPVLERAFAIQAGLGAIGKNNCLIVPRQGSYFFLAEILTTLPLPEDQPHTIDPCKNCQRCIDACPTNCILPDRTIDASRCISYLTIENKGEIPDDLKGKIGDWLFGCDVCQMVCPHNARPIEHRISLEVPVLSESLDLIPLFSLDEKSFKEEFGDTPLSRTKHRGLLRNAAIILGNQRFEGALYILENALANEPDPVIQDSCAWAIQKIKHENNFED